MPIEMNQAATHAEMLAALTDLEKRIQALMDSLRGPDGRRATVQDGVWWSLSSAQGHVESAIGKVLRYREQNTPATLA